MSSQRSLLPTAEDLRQAWRDSPRWRGIQRTYKAEDVVRLLDETSHAILFTRELMRTALEHLPPHARGLFGDLTSANEERIRAILLKNLNRQSP